MGLTPVKRSSVSLMKEKCKLQQHGDAMLPIRSKTLSVTTHGDEKSRRSGQLGIVAENVSTQEERQLAAPAKL